MVNGVYCIDRAKDCGFSVAGLWLLCDLVVFCGFSGGWREIVAFLCP